VTLRVTPPSSASIDSVVPVITPTTPLGSIINDSYNAFDVDVRVFYTASGPFSGSVTASGSWQGSDGSGGADASVRGAPVTHHSFFAVLSIVN
jgi:hypothetical protein